MKTSPVVRFAPSPNGYLHLGHAYSALLNYRFAMENDGRFLLRIEDIDIGRSRLKYIEAIYEDLEWLGIEWEQPVRKQSGHFEVYKNVAQRLAAMGLLYPCSASRKEIMAYIEKLPNADQYPRDPDGGVIYPGLHRGTPFETYEPLSGVQAVRLDMDKAVKYLVERNLLPQNFLSLTDGAFDGEMKDAKEPRVLKYIIRPELWGDVVLVRKDIPTSYHLSVVVDDALQGVTHVVRGKDLEGATSLHRILQALLDLGAPLYFHHNLIKVADSQEKLSKSAKDTSLRDLRQQGWSAEDVKACVFGQT